MMYDCAIEDRSMIIQAVLEGILSPEHVTLKELQRLESNMFELICDQLTPFATWETEQ